MRIDDILFKDSVESNNIIIVDEYKDWTRREIKDRVIRFSHILRQNAIKSLDKVVMISENSSDFIVMLFAIMQVGATAVPLDPQMSSESLDSLIRIVGVDKVCISRKCDGKFVPKECSTYEIIVVDMELHSDSISSEYGGCKDNELALILFSSGTTSGWPKGVQLTHNALCNNMFAILDYMKPDMEDTFFITKTMVHVSTLVGEVLVALYADSKIIAYNTLVTPNTMLHKISRSAATIVAVNPTILKLMVNTTKFDLDLSNVRLLYTSGAVISKDILQKAEVLFDCANVLNVYGLTEAGPRVCAQIATDTSRIYGAVGRPINGVEVKIIGDNVYNATDKDIGIIYVKSNSLMSGYFQNEEFTKQKLVDGWLNTGDLGYIEENGEVVVLGRRDDIIIRNANNIDPIVVENAIKKIDGILDCVVFGIPHDFYVNKIIAVIVCRDGINYTLQEVIPKCSTALLPHEYPQELHVWKEIPRTPNGKISRKLSSDHYLKLQNNHIKELPV